MIGGMILKWFSKESLWRELIRRETFTPGDEVEGYTVWKLAFEKVPSLIHFLRRREIMLLKSIPLGHHSNDFILGQIAENRFFQRFYDKRYHHDEGKKVDEYPLGKSSIPEKGRFMTQWKESNIQKHAIGEEQEGLREESEASP